MTSGKERDVGILPAVRTVIILLYNTSRSTIFTLQHFRGSPWAASRNERRLLLHTLFATDDNNNIHHHKKLSCEMGAAWALAPQSFLLGVVLAVSRGLAVEGIAAARFTVQVASLAAS